MADTKTASASHVQQIPGVENFKKLVDDNNSRFTQAFDEVAKAHSKWIEYGNTQIDEMSDLLKTQFNYVNDLATGWRKLSTESMKKAMESFAR